MIRRNASTAMTEFETRFKAMVDEFENTRKFIAKSESEGFASDRSDIYKMPVHSKKILDEIKADREYIRSLNPQPDEVFEIKGVQKKKYTWLPDRIECYNITRSELNDIARECVETHRTLRTASIHGASHSFSMLVSLLRNGINFDFANYVNLPNEMEDEREFILYYAVCLLQVPFVIIVPQNTAEDFYEFSGILPTAKNRWCTRDMKIKPFLRFRDQILSSNIPAKGGYLDIINFMGMQRHQSTRRSKMNPGPVPALGSKPPPFIKQLSPTCRVHEYGQHVGDFKKIKVKNWPADTMKEWFKLKPKARVTRQFNMLPVFELSEENNLELIRSVNGIQNPNEREYGTHGCLICPFKKIPYYLYLKENRPDLYKIALRRRDLATKRLVESKKREGTFTQFTIEEAEKFGLDYIPM